jgi:hypothetical protein
MELLPEGAKKPITTEGTENTKSQRRTSDVIPAKAGIQL